MTAVVSEPTPAPPPGAVAEDLPQVGADARSTPVPSERVITQARMWWGLEVAAWVDTALFGLVCAVAVSAFGTTYGGREYLVAGAIGVVAGAGVALGARLWCRGALTTGLLAAAGFFVFGGVAAAGGDALLGFVPTPASISALVDGAIGGWSKLLTTLPPVGDSANLLTIPYLCGFVSAVLGGSISLRTRRPTVALTLPVAVLCVAILVGTVEEVWSAPMTAGFAGLCVAWGSVRQRAQQRATLPVTAGLRWLAGLWTLIAAGALAILLTYAPIVTGTQARFVLRDLIEPPVDLRDYPSPLAGFRRYLDPTLEEAVLFTVEGLPPGARIRLATLDRYDGLVYQTAGAQADDTSSGYFQRVGEAIPVPIEGKAAEVTVEIGAYDDIWLPGAGWLGDIDFAGDRADAVAADFRYNVVTGSAVVPSGLQQGDRYSASVVLPPDLPDGWEQLGAAAVTQPPIEHAPEVVSEQATDFSGTEDTAGGRVARIAEVLRDEGWYSDGEGASPAGHSSSRMVTLLEQRDRMVGNAEQYATAMALMARDRGVPARVVMGFAPETADGGPVEVRGGDVTAWVEVALGNGVWVPIDPTPPKTEQLKETKDKPDPLPNLLTPPPPSTLPRFEDPKLDEEVVEEPPAVEQGFVLPFAVIIIGTTFAIPVLVVAAVTGAMAGLKSRRRNRRRGDGAPATRVAAGWEEVLDLARDLGDVVPDRSTRREAAALLGRPGVSTLAAQSDATVFGPAHLSDAEVERYWSDVELARQAMLGPLGRFDRWKATVNPTSLRSTRAGHGARRSRRGRRS